jgi:hypothetical protein
LPRCCAQAVGREEECIAMCRLLEDSHPIKKIKREAANLRYIMEAPKLELTKDERVTIPLLGDAEPNRCGRRRRWGGRSVFVKANM